MSPEHHGHPGRLQEPGASTVLDAMCRRIVDLLGPGIRLSVDELAFQLGESRHDELFVQAVAHLLRDPAEGGSGVLEEIGRRRLLQLRADRPETSQLR